MYFEVKLDLKSRIFYDEKFVKKSMRQIGNKAAKVAKNKAVSGGEFPNKRTGEMAKAIKVRVGSRGGYAAVTQKMPNNAKKFYPAFVLYGHGEKKEKKKSWIDAAYRQVLPEAQSKIKEAIFRGVNL